MEQKDSFKHIIRVANTDLDGNKKTYHALKKIKGAGFAFIHAVCFVSKVDAQKKAGNLTDKEVEQLDAVFKSPLQFQIPKWMLNRENDYETGEDKHLLGGDLKFTVENDIRRLKKIKSYRGIRHMLGQPTRGQRTRSNFRRNKGKVMGVQRAKAAPGASAKKDDKKK